jgi:predicted DNA-binding protein (MmcQ/YjbR family)
MPDIDIDFVDRDSALKLFKHIPASRIDNDRLVKHNTGVYLHSVPTSAVEAVCSVPYDHTTAEDYFKIDFLNVGIYKSVRDETHLIQLMETEPLWDLLEQEEFVNLLFHVNGHGSILQKMKPKNVEQLAAILAMIRPAKRYLIGKDWITVMTEAWTKPENNEYYFKKSHATAYAVAIVVQMNLICEQISYGFS